MSKLYLDIPAKEVAHLIALFYQDSVPAEQPLLFSFAIAYANKRHIDQAVFLKACKMKYPELPANVTHAEVQL
jgi:hypothetical protein